MRSSQTDDQGTPESNEWNIVNAMINNDTTPQQKISKTDDPRLTYSYLLLNINGQKKPFRVSHDILGQGAEGKVKIIENQQGQRYAVKVLANTSSLDTEISNMNEVGAAITDFIRKREVKFSKTLQTDMGDKRYVVMPLHKGTELKKVLGNKGLTDTQKIELALRCCESVKALHDRGILHRDIKSANFIASVDSSGKIEAVNVIDFGGSIKTNERGEVIAKPFGTPEFIAPELGGDKIAQAARERDKHQQIIRRNDALLAKKYDQMSMLKKRLEEPDADKSRFESEIDLLQKEINKNEQARDAAAKKANIEQEKLDGEFDKEGKHTSASDVYSLGIMFDKMFGLKLKDIGLADMLNANPEKRPDMAAIIQTMSNKLGIAQPQKKIDLPVKDNSNTVTERLPRNVEPAELHQTSHGKLCVLSADDMNKLNEMRAGNTNKYLKMNDSTIFLTIEGGAFAMHSPISAGAIGATYLVQNLDDYSWSVAKMVKGRQQDIRGQHSQWITENETLSSLNQLNGTLELTAGRQKMYISVQPYVHGKTYADVIEKAESEKLSVHTALLMSLKALGSLADLHEKHGLLHRDIKSENMMWDAVTSKAGLIDFGCAGKGTGENLEIADVSKRGTEKYQAPEIDFKEMMKSDRKYSEKTDVYSLGIIIGELTAQVKNQENHPAYQQLKQLQTALTHPDPASRPKAREAAQQADIILKSMTPDHHVESTASMMTALASHHADAIIKNDVHSSQNLKAENDNQNDSQKINRTPSSVQAQPKQSSGGIRHAGSKAYLNNEHKRLEIVLVDTIQQCNKLDQAYGKSNSDFGEILDKLNNIKDFYEKNDKLSKSQISRLLNEEVKPLYNRMKSAKDAEIIKNNKQVINDNKNEREDEHSKLK